MQSLRMEEVSLSRDVIWENTKSTVRLKQEDQKNIYFKYFSTSRDQAYLNTLQCV